MSEMYIQRAGENRRGCLRVLVFFAALGLLLAAVWGYAWSRRRAGTAVDADPVVTPVEAAATAPLAASLPAGPSAERASGLGLAPDGDPADPVRLLAEARRLYEENEPGLARDKAYAALESADDPALRSGIEAFLGLVHTRLVFAPYPMPEKQEYTVQPGDSLNRLARRFQTTEELIRRGNRISGSLIRVGDRLRVFTGPFRVEIDKTANDLTLYLNDRFFKRYRVGTGAYGKTPTGQFVIQDRIQHPAWFPAGQPMIPYGSTNNLLGTHWLALESLDDPGLTGYGIHGTWEPETIGHQASEGCVRLLNEEVEELYQLLPSGTPVRITE